jgi:plastocyanin
MALRASRFIRLALTTAPLFPGAVATGLRTKTALRLAAALCLAALPLSLLADTVTLPVAASVVGPPPFFSDVRVFNTSYDDVLNVTATYRCTPGSSAACATQPVRTFSLGPREARAFDNICAQLFGVPGSSLGAVEFVTSGSDLVVTSRLYSPAVSPPWPAGTVGSVGMFIPGLEASAAKPVTVLTNLSNAGSATGTFRTNMGVYNPNAAGVTATIRLYNYQGSFPPVPLGVVPVTLGPRTGTQISNIYKTLGFETLVTTTGFATVQSDNPANPLFTYAATADNTTQDPVLVVGAEDKAAPAGFNPPTPTPSGGAAPTPTPTPTSPAAATRIVNIGQAGNAFTDTVSGMSSSTIHAGDTVMWVWSSATAGPHSTTSGTCQPGDPGPYGNPSNCTGDELWNSSLHYSPNSYSRQFTTAGTFHYYCLNHGYMMMGTVQVLP